MRTSSLAFSELVPRTSLRRTGIRRVVRNKAVPGPTTSRRRPSGAHPQAGPARTQKNHQFCARPGAFTSIGSRLNLYCSAGRRRRRGRASVRLGVSGGKGRSSESRRRNIVREGARVASGEPARAIEGANRPFVARGFSSVGYAKSGLGGTHGQLVAVLGPPPVGLRGLLPVLLTARVKGEAGTSGPMRRRARDGPVGRRRGNPRRWAIRG